LKKETLLIKISYQGSNQPLKFGESHVLDMKSKISKYFDFIEPKVSDRLRNIMNLEAESERQKRSDILIADGKKQTEVIQAEAIRRSKILNAEGWLHLISCRNESGD
jgi:hypothetical protein